MIVAKQLENRHTIKKFSYLCKKHKPYAPITTLYTTTYTATNH